MFNWEFGISFTDSAQGPAGSSRKVGLETRVWDGGLGIGAMDMDACSASDGHEVRAFGVFGVLRDDRGFGGWRE